MVQHFHRVEVGTGHPTKSSLSERAFSGISRTHAVAHAVANAVAGTKTRVRRPMSWDMLEVVTFAPSWGSGGRVLWLCLALGPRSHELFATDAGVAHQVHCLTRRDVAFSEVGSTRRRAGTSAGGRSWLGLQRERRW